MPEAGAAESIGEPKDQEYGERSAGVKDRSGNAWYIATAKGEHFVPKGLQTLIVYLFPLRAEPVIAFMKRAFDGTDVQKYASPQGVIHHASVRIGDSMIEMGEAHGNAQPMPPALYTYVADLEETYQRALNAGATSLQPPKDQGYGDRTAWVKDAWGNTWYLAAPMQKNEG